MDKIRVTNHTTSETKDYTGTMMVAPNGVVFIKKGSKVVLALNSDSFTAEVL